MRSLSRTELTSGLVTTTAMSAWCMASWAPRSMPAGLSHTTQSKLLAQLADDAGDAVRRQRVLVAGLAGGQEVEGIDALVADERLGELGVALDHVDEVIDDPALGAHHEVEVAQAHVEIHDRDSLAALGERGPDGGGRGRLAHASLT